MAEIRKHQPVVTDAIDRALLAALGEDVRPVTPGARREEATEQAPAEPVPTRPRFTVAGAPTARFAVRPVPRD